MSGEKEDNFWYPQAFREDHTGGAYHNDYGDWSYPIAPLIFIAGNYGPIDAHYVEDADCDVIVCNTCDTRSEELEYQLVERILVAKSCNLAGVFATINNKVILRFPDKKSKAMFILSDPVLVQR